MPTKKPTINQESAILVLKQSKCPTSTGTSNLGYDIGTDETGEFYFKITSNSGGGFFSEEWISLSAIHSAWKKWPEDRPITSMALRPLFQGKSANNPSFLVAILVKEGLLEAAPDKRRHYQRCNPKAFLAEVKKPKGSHSKARKPRAKAKGRAGSGMTKPTKLPAKAK